MGNRCMAPPPSWAEAARPHSSKGVAAGDYPDLRWWNDRPGSITRRAPAQEIGSVR